MSRLEIMNSSKLSLIINMEYKYLKFTIFLKDIAKGMLKYKNKSFFPNRKLDQSFNDSVLVDDQVKWLGYK